MVNKKIFSASSSSSKEAPTADVKNAAGGKAFSSSAVQSLSQIAATNCFNGTYYVSAETNLQLAKQAAEGVEDSEFLAKVAIYSRDKAYMKDMPAFLTVMLAARIKPDTFTTKSFKKIRVRNKESELFHKVFDKVIDNGKMLRNFIQIARSGAAGRKFNMSAGAVRKAIQRWFDNRSPDVLFKASIGNDPSMRDILRMCRPKANSPQKNALFAYEVGKSYEFGSLPEIVQSYENFKKNKEVVPSNVDFRMLDSLGLTNEQWKEVARNASWHMTRMNLNTFHRHGVLEDKTLVKIIADRLRDQTEVQRSRVFPYQLMMSYVASLGNVPIEIGNAIQDAMELAIDNVPDFKGQIYICVDTSGSMGSPVTGHRPGSTTAVRCVDVASLFASAILRKNQNAQVIPFDTRVHKCDLNPRDTVITNAQKLAKFGGGGTDCATALHSLNAVKATGDAVIYISDYESWVDGRNYGNNTGMLTEWRIFKSHNKNAKLVCIDLTPRNNAQVKENEDILQVGGFGDGVFDVVANFIETGWSVNHWVSEIEKINLGD